MDRLKQFWDLQLSFNDKFFQKKLDKSTSELTMEEKVVWTKNQLLSIVKEAMEVLDEIPNWKEHRKTNDSFIPSNLLEEIIDVNKFAVGLAQIWGMDAEQYFNEYMRKSYVVEQRWAQEQELNLIDNSAKVVGIDIDGVLGDYPKHFINFTNQYMKQMNPNVQIPVYKTLKDVKEDFKANSYEKLKTAYRESGWKATMPAKPWAAELTEALKEKGYTIIILTARPYKEFSRIYPDTLEFLHKNNIKFDAIIWDKKKHLKIMKEFPDLKFMIEDTPEIAIEIADAGFKVYMPVNEINQNVAASCELWANIEVVSSLKQVIDIL